MICWCRLCRGTIRRPEDIVREHQLSNGLDRNAPPSHIRGDRPLVILSDIYIKYICECGIYKFHVI